jgi:hypothetical protein
VFQSSVRSLETLKPANRFNKGLRTKKLMRRERNKSRPEPPPEVQVACSK